MQDRCLIAAALLLAAACAKTEAPPAAGATVTVLIGHAGPLTGSIAHQGKDDENGVALALDQANAKHLVIGGRPAVFRMLSEDDQGDPKIGTTVAQKLVDAHVAAVIGHLNSGVTIPASEIYAKAGIPVITGSATNPMLTERGMKNVFRTIGRDDQQGPAIAAYIANELKARTVALVDDKTAYGEGLACSQAGLPAASATQSFRGAFIPRYGETKLYAPFFYDAANVVIEAMRRADSTDPAKFVAEIYRTNLDGATGHIEFDAKGDRKDAEMTIFRMRGGKIVPVAVVKGGVLAPFGT